MKAVWKLLTLPLRQMPLAVWLVVVLFLGSLAGLVVIGGAPWLAVTGVAVWFWHILAGTSLRSAMRMETRILPHFRLRLLQAGGLDLMLSVVVPTVLALAMVTGIAPYALLFGAGLLLIASLGLASGTGMRALFLAWVGLIALGWFPHAVHRVVLVAQDSLLTPVAMVLLSGLLLYLALHPLLKLDDQEITESPLGTALGGSPSRFGNKGPGRPRTRYARLMSGMLGSFAESVLRKALHRFEQDDSGRRRIALIRAVLLPHDNPRAVLLQVGLIALFGSLYMLATHASQRWDATYVGAYAVFIGTVRFNTVGRGLARMRANLTELYMTLAPRTRAEFQATLVDTLSWLVGVAMFNCLALALLIIVLLHPHQPARLLLAVLISGFAAAMFAFSSYMVGPESNSGQMIMRLILLVFYTGLYALAYWLLGRFGLTWGALLATLLTLPFGIGTWVTARREYLRRAPRFDAPL